MSYSVNDPKIGRARRPDGSPADNDRVEIGPTELAFREWDERGIPAPNLDTLRAYRLQRVRDELARCDYAGAFVTDPVNIRYLSDATHMPLWAAHNQSRACFVATNGPLILFEYDGAYFLAEHLPLIDEMRPMRYCFYFFAGDDIEKVSAEFAAEIVDLVTAHGGGNHRLAADKLEIPLLRAIEHLGVEVVAGQPVLEQARSVKDANELNAMRCAIASTEASMAVMQKSLRPGMTENELWSVLHAENIRRGGEWIEARLLSSGPRTNPWYRECGPRVIQDGDIVAFDTDLIGPYGYCADISRTWLCGGGKPSDEERRLYQIAAEHLDANRALLRPGLSFAEFSAKSDPLPDEFRQQRYGSLSHGVGLCDEYPSIKPPETFAEYGYDGHFQVGMVVCVEAYIGAVGGKSGVKLEEQVVITETGHEVLSQYPLEADFLSSPH